MYHTESKEEIKDNHINGYRKNNKIQQQFLV